MNLTQDFVFETDSLENLESMLNTIVPILFPVITPGPHTQLFVTQRVDDTFVGTYLNITKDEPVKKQKAVTICSVEDYAKHIQDEDEVFGSYEYIVKRVMAIVKEADRKEFRRKAGDGFCSDFNPFDGSVGIGYRLKYKENGGWDALDVSLCHMYYGK